MYILTLKISVFFKKFLSNEIMFLPHYRIVQFVPLKFIHN